MTMLIMIALIGLASAGAYLARRKWMDALLVVVAAAALAGLVGDFKVPAGREDAVTRLDGDGLRAAQLHDLPARRLEWTAPKDDALQLDFPRTVTPGRMFRLSATMPSPAPRRLQLLAENGQLIAETSGDTATLTVQWMPPVAETLLLKARLLDAKGKPIAEGPVPFEVREAVPLQVQGRFSSPSFDARTFNALLAASNAVLDWQVVLGKTVTRSETARTDIARPDLLVQDAAHIEKMSESARAALLAQVAGGTPLLVLAASANEPAFWSRTFQLDLKEQAETKPSGAPLALMTAPFNPATKALGPWATAGDRIWSRSWQKGRIVWIGVAEWHRYAIAEPQALGVWWQDLLDRAGVRRAEDIAWLEPEDMPLPGHRLEVCALGVKGDVTFPQLKQTLAWQRRPDKADAACVAVWPSAPGWLRMQSGSQSGQVYVYDVKDWPLWQKAQRRKATAMYAARTPAPLAQTTKPLPSWPFALLFACSMLLLWWRERR
jgi:hypothetical protein